MRYAKTKSVFAVVLALLGTMVFAPGVHAQTMEDDTWDFGRMDRYSITLYAGGFSPATDIGDGKGQFDNSFTVGGTAAVWLTRHMGARANLLFAQTDVQGLVNTDQSFDDPNIWMYTADLILRAPMPSRRGWFAPYVVGGLGAKTYVFDTIDNDTHFAGNIGAGMELRFPGAVRWGLRAEVRDFISVFDVGTFDETQHDMIWTGGLTVSF